MVFYCKFALLANTLCCGAQTRHADCGVARLLVPKTMSKEFTSWHVSVAADRTRLPKTAEHRRL